MHVLYHIPTLYFSQNSILSFFYFDGIIIIIILLNRSFFPPYPEKGRKSFTGILGSYTENRILLWLWLVFAPWKKYYFTCVYCMTKWFALFPLKYVSRRHLHKFVINYLSR